MSKQKRWNLIDTSAGHDDEIKAICRELGIKETTARLLFNRGHKTPEAAKNFISLGSELLHDPFLLCDMKPACERINRALSTGESIVIYGDYDVDGVTSVSALYLYLSSRGANVSYYIPNRSGEGYGVNMGALDKFAQNGNTLMITVDTGITATEETKYAHTLGLDVIVTDHHECHDELPDAVAVVNPRRVDSPYPFKELAGAGVAFKLICALEIEAGKLEGRGIEQCLSKVCAEYIDLIALGTVADVMPLADENRLIVSMGLRQMEKGMRPGLKALAEQSSADPQKTRRITSSLISFVIAPKINAAGRISSASIAVELFLTDDVKRANEIAAELCETNRRRQAEENSIIEQTFKKIASEHDFENDPVIVLDDDNWHHGVIGIVSSRITEKFNRPSILISFEGDVGKGSGRSIKGLNLVEALMSCSDLLLKFGGHELAAGLSIERDKLPEFKRRINEYAREHLSSEDFVTTIDVDLELGPEDINLECARELSLLEPCGISNPEPKFMMRGMTADEIVPIGAGRHSKLLLSKDGTKIAAVYFGTPAATLDIAPGEKIDAVFGLSINEFRGVCTPQITIRDLCLCAEDEKKRAEETLVYKKMKNDPDAKCDPSEIPTRDDFARVYLFLKREIRNGTDTFPARRISALMAREDGDDRAIPYAKLKFIIDIFRETNIIGVEEIPPDACAVDDDAEHDIYKFKINYMNKKVNLDKSCILKRLKSMTRRT